LSRALTIAALVCALVLAPRRARAESTERLIESLAARVLAGRLEVGRATLGRTIELRDLVLRDSDGELIARVARARLQVPAGAILGASVIEALELEGVAVKLRRLPDGRVGTGPILRRAGGGGGGAERALAIERLEVRGPLVLGFPDRAPSTIALAFAGRLAASNGALRVELDRVVLTVGKLVVGGRGSIDVPAAGATPKVSLRGQLSGVPTALARALQLASAATERAPWEWELAIDGPQPHAKAVVRPPHGELRLEAAAADWRAHLIAHGLDLADLAGGVAPGAIAIAAQGELAPDDAGELRADLVAADLRRIAEASGRATAHLELRSTGDLRSLSGSLRASGSNVWNGGLELGEVNARIAGDRRRIEVTASSHGSRGAVELSAEATPAWTEDRPAGFDGRILQLSLEGRGQRWRLERPARIQLARALILDQVALGREGGPEHLTLAGRVELRAGRLDLQATARQLALRTLAGALGAELALPELAVDARARVHGALGAPLVELQADGIAPPDPRVGRGPASVHVTARLADRRLTGKAALAADDAQLAATFDLPAVRSAAPLKLHAHATAVPLAWLRPLAPGVKVDGTTALDLDLSGTRLQPRLDATLTARLAGGGALDARLRAPLPGPGAAARVPLDGTLGLHAIPLGRLLPPLPATLVLDGALRLTGTAGDPLLEGQVSAGGTTSIGAASTRLTVRWQRALEATVDATLDGAPLASGRGTLSLPLASVVRGTVDRDAPLVFDGTLPGLGIDRLAPPALALGGVVSGTIALRSPLSAPVATVHLGTPALTVAGSPLGPAAIEATLDRTGARAELSARPPGGGSFRIDGEATAARRAVHLRAGALAFDVREATGRVEIEGVLDADLSVTDDGTLHPSGTCRVSRGVLHLGHDRLDGLQLSANLEPGRLVLSHLELARRAGRLSATGELRLDGLRPGALTAQLHAHELPLERDNLGLWLDADATLALERDAHGLSGELRITRGDAHVVRAGAGRTLQPIGPLADVTVIDRLKGPAVVPVTVAIPRLRLPFALRIEVPGPFHITSRELDVSARGSLALESDAGLLSLTGRAEALRGGHLELFDRRYDLERAAITFRGARKPELDVAVSRELGETLLTLEIRGPTDNPQVRLTADPPLYDETQIGGLVAAGDPQAAASSSQIGHQMVGVITGLIAGRLRDKLAPALPVDVIKVAPGATSATPSRLEIGKFVLGDRLYVSYVYQFGGLTLPTRRLNAHEAQVQLKLVRRLSLDARYGDAGAGALDLTFTLRK
jgi:hypothetical protein